jgi:magnesium transporter
MSMVGNLRKVARLARCGRRRVDLSHPARSPLGSTVVTVRRGRHGSLGPLREDLEAEPGRLATGPSAVLHAIADHVVDDYLTVADAVQNDIDQVETDVFSPHSPRNADAGRIYQLKRELLEIKRAVVPLSGNGWL